MQGTNRGETKVGTNGHDMGTEGVSRQRTRDQSRQDCVGRDIVFTRHL